MRTHCAKCSKELEPTRIGKQGYCKSCHAAYMRENRTRHSELTPQQKQKANARTYANVYVKRGTLLKQPCSICGNVKAEMHHNDYKKPLEVIWLCRPCHLNIHKQIELN